MRYSTFIYSKMVYWEWDWHKVNSGFSSISGIGATLMDYVLEEKTK